MYSIVKNEGWKNLFNGLIPALFLVLNPVIQYTIFEQLKTLIVTRRKHKLTPFDALILGALGKLIATIVTYPYITVRSRMHLQNVKGLNLHSRSSSTTAGSSSTTTGSETELNDSVQSLPDEIESSSQLPELKQQEKPKGMLALMLEIVRNEGFITFYNGLSLKLLQSILSAAFLFYFKEELLLKTDSLIKTSKSVGGRSVSIVTLPIRRYNGADK